MLPSRSSFPIGATVLFGAIAVLGVILGVIYTKKFRVQIENLDAKLDISRAMNFPSKLRVYLKNNSTSAIMAWSPRWEAGRWDVQREDWGRLQVEKYPGSWNVGVLGDWLNPESTEGRIETGNAFCACIALNRKVPDDELRRRLLLENVGTMVVPVEIKGKRKNWRIRL